MFRDSAWRLIPIEENVDYSKQDYKVFSVHCIEGNSENLEVQAIEGNPVIYPPYSFVQGAVYHIFLKQFLDLGGAKFVGFCSSEFSYPTIKLKTNKDVREDSI